MPCSSAEPLRGTPAVSRFIAVDVVRQAPLIGHELLPADITRVGSLQADRPVRDRHLDGSPNRSGAASDRILLPTTVNISPSIGRIVQDIAHPCAVSLAPDHLVRGRSEQGPHRQRQSVGAQKAHHAARALQLPELGEDEVQARLHFFVRIEDDRAGAVIDEPGRQRLAGVRRAPPSGARPDEGVSGFGEAPPRS